MTDGPEGFYVVWDSNPDKGFNIGEASIKPFKPSYAGLVTPATLFEQNKIVTDVPEQQLTKIFPTPVSYQETGGTFKLSSSLKISADQQFAQEEQQLSNTIESLFGKKFESQSGTIKLQFKDGLKAEAYELSVTTNGITISASTPAGIFYGIQSLKTLIPCKCMGTSR